MTNHRAVVIGLGGIGSWLLQGLVPYLAHMPDEHWSLTLVDGDSYEPVNASRQVFSNLGNKAAVQADALRHVAIQVLAVTSFVAAPGVYTDKALGIEGIVAEGETVFLCVDNHATRKVVFEYAATLKDVNVYSGGNDVTDGNVNVYLRKDGRDLTPNPLGWHPELREPPDKAPHELSCEELAAAGTPQLLFANMMAAVLMLSAFHSRRVNALNLASPEVYFDILTLATAPRRRKKNKETT